MMGIGKLLMELKALLVDPASNRIKIEKLLRRSRGAVAEFEVLRFYASSKGVVPDDLEERLRSQDLRVRRAAVSTIDVLFPRARAGRFLRMVAKDPDAQTRTMAFHALRRLQLGDVAIPDTRYKVKRRIRPGTSIPGAWNATGWLFGLHRRKVKASGRPADLAKNKLPPLANVNDVLALLGVADAKACKRLCRAGTASGSPYVEFEIEKANGSKRSIAAPRAPLRKVQRALLRAILDKVPLHDAAHGFVKGRSTVTNAKPHERAALVVKLDLVDFFPTMHFRRVRGVFNQLGYSLKVAHLLASLCTYRPVIDGGEDGKIIAWPGILPQGAPTSPALANITCRRMDARLAALAKKSGARYTRYADDLTFSFDAEPKTLGRFLWWVDQICQQEGFSENARKRRILRKKAQQRVTGIVVNSGLFIPRRDRHRFRAVLANVKKNGLEAEARGRKDFAAYLQGFAAYVKMVQPELGSKWVAEVKALTAK
jgi:retron-type reverse transcriptase